MKRLLSLALTLTASLLGQFAKTRGESEFTENAAGQASFQQYFWEDFTGTSGCFLMQRVYLVEGGSKLAEFGAGWKLQLRLLKAVTAAWNTDGYLATPFVFGGKIAGRQWTYIADHKLKVIAQKPGFTFMKAYYPLRGIIVARWEGTLRDDCKWLSFQPGLELRQHFRAEGRDVSLVFEYDTKNHGPMSRLDFRF
jgi:hypothetical protein